MNNIDLPWLWRPGLFPSVTRPTLFWLAALRYRCHIFSLLFVSGVGNNKSRTLLGLASFAAVQAHHIKPAALGAGRFVVNSDVKEGPGDGDEHQWKHGGENGETGEAEPDQKIDKETSHPLNGGLADVITGGTDSILHLRTPFTDISSTSVFNINRSANEDRSIYL